MTKGLLTTRESWHDGHEIRGDTINMGHPHCAGCGRLLGLACVAIEAGYVPPPEPAWPFDEATCPVCYLRKNSAEASDPLTQRALALSRRR